MYHSFYLYISINFFPYKPFLLLSTISISYFINLMFKCLISFSGPHQLLKVIIFQISFLSTSHIFVLQLILIHSFYITKSFQHVFFILNHNFLFYFHSFNIHSFLTLSFLVLLQTFLKEPIPITLNCIFFSWHTQFSLLCDRMIKYMDIFGPFNVLSFLYNKSLSIFYKFADFNFCHHHPLLVNILPIYTN